MTVWIMVSLMTFGAIEVELFAAKDKCESLAAFIKERGGFAVCMERPVK